MTAIPLRTNTIGAYLGTHAFNGCGEISSIRCKPSTDHRDVTMVVEARIPASSTRQKSYDVCVLVHRDGSNIIFSSCSCPQGNTGGKCKHVFKVLCRIAQGPIAGPTHQVLAREAHQHRCAEKLLHCSVYVAIACKSQLHSGSDYRRTYFDNVDQEILGIFFSKKKANECAREHVKSDDEDDEDEVGEDISVDSEDEETFVYDGSDEGDYNDENMFEKVWVERRLIEDASHQFHK
jgi:hypothetical protein